MGGRRLVPWRKVAMKIGTITFLVIDVTLDKEEVVGRRWVMVGSWRSSCDVDPPRGLLQDEDE